MVMYVKYPMMLAISTHRYRSPVCCNRGRFQCLVVLSERVEIPRPRVQIGGRKGGGNYHGIDDMWQNVYPEFWEEMAHGHLAVLLEADSRVGELEGTISPMAKASKT